MTTTTRPRRPRVDGDRRALELLLDRHADRIHAVCRRIVAHPEDALDATQEAMIAIARGITGFDGRAAFSTWCYRIATNAALDELRRKRRRPVPAHPDAPEPVSPGSAPHDDRRPRGSTSTPPCSTLPEEFRVAVVLRDLCDLDYAEIAEVLDMPPGHGPVADLPGPRAPRGTTGPAAPDRSGHRLREPVPAANVRTTMADDARRSTATSASAALARGRAARRADPPPARARARCRRPRTRRPGSRPGALAVDRDRGR